MSFGKCVNVFIWTPSEDGEVYKDNIINLRVLEGAGESIISDDSRTRGGSKEDEEGVMKGYIGRD